MAKKKKTSSRKKTSLKSNLSENLKLALGENIWPMERDVLYRPDRLKYVRKLVKTEGCVFCQAAKAKIGFESLLLYRSEFSMIVLNKYPYNPGHILVLPLRHCDDILKLSDAEYFDLQTTFRLGFRAIHQAYTPSGANAGLNHGAVAGAGIPEHLHFHIVPRWLGDMNFFPLIGETKALPTDLQTSYDQLHKVLCK